MHQMRTAIGGFLIACGMTASLGAQSPLPDRTQQRVTGANDSAISVTGCLMIGPHGDYLLEGRQVALVNQPGVAMTPPPGTPEPPIGGASHIVAWKLKGGSDLIKYVTQRVEVTGWLTADDTPLPQAVGTSGTIGANTGADSRRYRLGVRSVKMIAPNCELP